MSFANLYSPFIVLLAVAGPGEIAKEEGEKQAPQEVRQLAGTYTGSWTLFGIDDKGQIVQRMVWTDTLKAQGPEVQGDRAYISTTDEMVFEGSKIPPMTVRGREGYFLGKDGRLGDYFIEA